jgi:predicted phosphoadenosine phosphosulfate sulfurtransferase
MPKHYKTDDVYVAAKKRLEYMFDEFDHVSVAFSGGKDSTVMTHLALEVAEEMGIGPLHVYCIDLEGNYKMTDVHIKEILELPNVIPYWICLPLNLRNGTSVHEPYWTPWDPEDEEHWIRPMPPESYVINIDNHEFDFWRDRMEFEEFAPLLSRYFNDKLGGTLINLVGIRSDESLNRFRTVTGERASRYKGVHYTTKVNPNTYNGYPIYDWRTEDVWRYIGKNDLSYNKLYDHMYLNGKSIHEMRICQPYGDDQKQGLDQFHAIEPETWNRTVNRVQGANFGAKNPRSKALGYYRGTGLPEAMPSWKDYTLYMLKTLPKVTSAQYMRKFAVFIEWWGRNGYPFDDIPDIIEGKSLGDKSAPSWARMSMTILKLDFICKSLSFAQNKNIRDWIDDVEAGTKVAVRKGVQVDFDRLVKLVNDYNFQNETQD